MSRLSCKTTVPAGFLPFAGVNLTLTQDSYEVFEDTGFVEVCALLEGELEGIVEAIIFTISGNADGI